MVALSVATFQHPEPLPVVLDSPSLNMRVAVMQMMHIMKCITSVLIVTIF